MPQSTTFMKRIFTVTLLSSICLLLSIPASAFHYFCGFETSQDTVGWRFATGRRISTTFVIGSATHQVGAKSLYVSADGGTTAGYVSTASGFMTVAYRKFTLAAGRYDIAFDLRMAGDEKYDLFRLAYFPVNDAGGAYREPQGAQKGSTFPPLVVLNSFTDDKGRVDFHNVGHNISGKITIPKDGDYWLAFYFKEGGGLNTESNPGVRIDNIQIVSESYPTDCIAKPSALDVKVDAAKVDVTWQGNAPLYELMYYNTMNHSDTTYTVVSGITTNTYSIPRARLSDGNYNFLVRSICSSDTGLWARKTSVLIYDKSKLVIDYLDLNASGVRCTKGVFDNPCDTVGVKDFGTNRKTVCTRCITAMMSTTASRATNLKPCPMVRLPRFVSQIGLKSFLRQVRWNTPIV